MPFRSPKMYFAIFGFQRFVWWPKWTPASRSSFMVICAIAGGSSRSVCLRAPCDPRVSPGTATAPGARVWWLARTGVYLNVVGRQVAEPHVVLSGTEAQVDRQGHLGLGQLRLHTVPADTLPDPPAGRHLLLAVPDRDLVLLHRDAGGADR